MKKICLIILIITMISASFGVFAMEEDKENVRVWLNGEYLEFDQNAIIENGRTLVPLRTIFEKFDTKVLWEEDTKTVVATKDNFNLRLTIAKDTAIVNGKEVKLETKCKILNGRTLVPLRFISDSIGAKTNWDEVNKTAIISYNPKVNEVVDFNLGKKTIPTETGNDLEFSMIGGISVPKEKNSPVVVVLHGSHNVYDVDTSRYDLGFSYLLKELSKNGYFAIAINANMQYSLEHGENSDYERLNKIVDAHLDELQKANEGAEVGYGIDIREKADMSNISLVGHSSSGQGILSVAKDQLAKGRTIKTLVSLAPSLNNTMEKEDFVSIPTGIIIPQYDDDVSTLDGQTLYDEIKGQNANYSQLTYLYGADHNSFNESILVRGQITIPEEIKFHKMLTKNQHRDFFSQYVINFLNFSQNKETRDATGFDFKLDAPSKMYDYDVLTSIAIPKSVNILTPEIKVTTKNATAKRVVSSQILSENTAGAFSPPGNGNVELLSVQWEENGLLSIPVSQDLKKYSVLNFTIAQDSGDKKNHQKNQAVTIVLKDKNKKESRKILDENTPALSYQKGIMEEIDLGDIKFEKWTSFTPLSSMRVNLKDFKDVDLSNITEITMEFANTKSGKLMINSIDLQK